jgi:hypothetical protein
MKRGSTAKRLRNAAQGCGASQLPRATGLVMATPLGLRLFVSAIKAYDCRRTFNSSTRGSGATPLGLRPI